MSSQLITNLSYRGKKYLDARQDSVKTLDNLRTWSIPIPPGFEVFVESEKTWYYYHPENTEDPGTGRFREREEKKLDRYKTKIEADLAEQNRTLVEKIETADTGLSERVTGLNSLVGEVKTTAEQGLGVANQATTNLANLSDKVTALGNDKLDKSTFETANLIQIEEITNLNDLLS